MEMLSLHGHVQQRLKSGPGKDVLSSFKSQNTLLSNSKFFPPYDSNEIMAPGEEAGRGLHVWGNVLVLSFLALDLGLVFAP